MARYALVIGISQYGGSLPNLSKPAIDAEAVAQRLEAHGNFQEVIRLPDRWNPDRQRSEVGNRKLTGKELGAALQQFLNERAAQSEALIYFSGHGFTLTDILGEVKGYLAPSDCQIEAEEQRNGISLDSLNELIRKSNLSSLVLLLDCCNSGYFLERSSIEQTLTAFSTQRDYYLIAASRSFEAAWEGEAYSVFTEALLQGLSAENADRGGRISGDRLFDYVSTVLAQSGQEPIRMGWGRSITLVTHQPAAAPQTGSALNLQNPYLGLQSFEAAQTQYFYGRERSVRALLDRLSRGRFLAVIGASGCGKSSLVKAGLLPELGRDRLPSASQWQTEIMTPGEQPDRTLSEILSRHAESGQPFVLFIDQFEEVFTLCEDEAERAAFLRRMAAEATSPTCLTRVIVAIRGDFLDRCAAYPEPARLINQTQPTSYVVPPLSPVELEQAIERPAVRNGVTFEPGLVAQIVADVVDRPGALPLLQYALMKLWQVCITEVPNPEPVLTDQGYQQIGGVKGALDQRATQLYRDFSPADRDFVRRLFMELVQLGEGQEVTRRRASWERISAIADTSEQLQRVIRQLASQQQRLIVTDEKTVEVAHEALLNEWTLLHSWIREDRESIRLSRALEADCHDWHDRYQQSDEALLMGAQLAAIEDWIDRTQPKLTRLEAEFVHRSRERRDRQLQAQIEQERQLRAAAEARAKAEKRRTQITAVAGLLVALLLTALGLLQVRQVRLARMGEVNTLVNVAEAFAASGSQLEALAASVRALSRLQDVPGTQTKTVDRLQAVMATLHERNRFEGHTDSVNTVSYSPTDELIASGSDDRTIKLWKPDGSPAAAANPMLHDAEVWLVNFSRDGEYIASASADATVKIWRRDGSPVTTLSGHQGSVNFASFSPDNRAIVSGGDDGTIRLWKINFASPNAVVEPPQTLLGHTDHVRMVEFSPNGQLIASAADDNTIKLWRADGTFIADLLGHQLQVRYASFSRDSQSLVSVSADREIKIWSWKTNPADYEVETLATESNRSYAVRYSPDQKIIAATSADGTVRRWQVGDRQELSPLGRHKDIIYDLSFRSDSKVIATASLDQTIRIWSLEQENSSSVDLDKQKLFALGCEWIGDYIRTNSYARKNYQNIATSCQAF